MGASETHMPNKKRGREAPFSIQSVTADQALAAASYISAT